MVDKADSFSSVLQRAVAWLQEKDLGTKYKYAVLTDGYDCLAICELLLLLLLLMLL